jgi:hypothetical protein
VLQQHHDEENSDVGGSGSSRLFVMMDLFAVSLFIIVISFPEL